MKPLAMVLVLALGTGTALANDGSRAPETNDTEERSPVWFGTFVTSTVVSVAAISVYAYSYKAVDDEVALIRAEDLGHPSSSITEQDCGDPNIVDTGGHFRKACTWSNRSRSAALVTMIAVPLAVVTGYFAFRSLPKKEKRSIAVIPTVTTQSAGAIVDIRW